MQYMCFIQCLNASNSATFKQYIYEFINTSQPQSSIAVIFSYFKHVHIFMIKALLKRKNKNSGGNNFPRVPSITV